MFGGRIRKKFNSLDISYLDQFSFLKSTDLLKITRSERVLKNNVHLEKIISRMISSRLRRVEENRIFPVSILCDPTYLQKANYSLKEGQTEDLISAVIYRSNEKVKLTGYGSFKKISENEKTFRKLFKEQEEERLGLIENRVSKVLKFCKTDVLKANKFLKSLSCALYSRKRVLQKMAERSLREFKFLAPLETLDRVKPKPEFGRLFLPYELDEKLLSQNDEEEKLRSDFSYINAYAIDDKYTKDVDDAIGVDKMLTKEGNKRFFIFVADVTSYVDFDSVHFHCAMSRMTSLYCAEKTEHLFSNNFANKYGLAENCENRVVVFEVHMNDKGEVEKHFVKLGSTRNVKRVTYEEADEVLEQVHSLDLHTKSNGPNPNDIKRLAHIAGLFLKVRMQNFALQMENKNVVTRIKKTGRNFNLFQSLHPAIILDEVSEVKMTTSKSIVENFMIIANNVAGAALLARKLHAPYRVSVFEKNSNYHEREVTVPQKAEWSELRALLLQKLPKVVVQSESQPHRMVGCETYVHATSPIRRASDLMTHYCLRSAIKGVKPPFDKKYLDHFCEVFNYVEGDHKKIMREREEFWSLVRMKKIFNRGEKIKLCFHVFKKKKSLASLIEPKFHLYAKNLSSSDLNGMEVDLHDKIEAVVIDVNPECAMVDVIVKKVSRTKIEKKKMSELKHKSDLQNYCERKFGMDFK